VKFEMKLPDLGEGLTESEVARWLVDEGDRIEEDDALVEIATDKTTVVIPSPCAGFILAIHVAEGDTVPVGTTLVTIGEPFDDDAVSEPSIEDGEAAGSPASPHRVIRATRPPISDRASRATPLVRRIAAERGINLAAVSGTGSNGQITERDLAIHTTPQRAAERREKLRGVRRQIAAHLAVAHREVPSVTFVEECDFTNVDLSRMVALALKATAESLQEFPELNARLEGDEIVFLHRYDLGVAVETSDGLLVPVVRDCDTRTVAELELELQRLVEAARSGTLLPEELRGGTFTVTSAGKLGGVFVTPLVNYPEVAILGLHKVSERPVVRDAGIAIRRIGNVSVTFDHRVIDGSRAANFCLHVIGRLQSPC
jgi:pyruvate/2-oxoglutarate dehydrogenase complex dihydrolipoamide acyltransferase (E2) component